MAADDAFRTAVARLGDLSSPAEVAPGRPVRAVDEPAVAALAASLAPPGPNRARVKRRLEIAALRAGLAPRRYLRNLGTLGLEGQARLLEARVGVAGLGGLGGLVSETLARAGIGELVLVDPDVATDDNLNRQLLATEETLGRPKVDVAAARLAAVNSATTVETHRLRAEENDFARLFRGTAAVVDCLDSVPARFALFRAAASVGAPLVHGAIAGLSGHVTTFFPGDPGPEVLYGPLDPRRDRGIETLVGNPSATPAMIAALQAQEVVKVLSGVGQPLRGRLLVLDALSGYAAVFELWPEGG